MRGDRQGMELPEKTRSRRSSTPRTTRAKSGPPMGFTLQQSAPTDDQCKDDGSRQNASQDKLNKRKVD
jgi:hypothetical protein